MTRPWRRPIASTLARCSHQPLEHERDRRQRRGPARARSRRRVVRQVLEPPVNVRFKSNARALFALDGAGTRRCHDGVLAARRRRGDISPDVCRHRLQGSALPDPFVHGVRFESCDETARHRRARAASLVAGLACATGGRGRLGRGKRRRRRACATVRPTLANSRANVHRKIELSIGPDGTALVHPDHADPRWLVRLHRLDQDHPRALGWRVTGAQAAPLDGARGVLSRLKDAARVPGEPVEAREHLGCHATGPESAPRW